MKTKKSRLLVSRFVAVLAFALCGALAPSMLGQAPAKKAAPGKAAGEQPKFKAIWEPVNVPEDVALVSVHFVSPEVGWVAGGKTTHVGGVIYHTKNGGKTWELQAGDAQSDEGGYSGLHFVDANTGYAVQLKTSGDYQLVKTSDGQSWAPSGNVPEHRYEQFFTTPTTGFIADWRRNIIRTTDSGKTWKPVKQCRIKTEIGGLTRDAECYFYSVHFPTATTGYAIGALPENAGNMLARTDDGGDTWDAWVVLPGETAYEGSLWFLDAENGVFRSKVGKMFRTSDGGKTWNGVSGTAEYKSAIRFADSEVGWMIYYRKMTYTTNGGKSWLSREIAFPAMVAASSFPARNSGYVVGEHGMVYRYRIVPIDYNVKGMLAAPALAAR